MWWHAGAGNRRAELCQRTDPRWVKPLGARCDLDRSVVVSVWQTILQAADVHIDEGYTWPPMPRM